MGEFYNIKVSADAVGRALARTDDHVQAEILNVFAEELSIACRGRPDDQICALTHRLSSGGRELIKTIAEFVELREKAEAEA